MRRRDFLEFVRCTALAAAIPNDWRVRFRPHFADDPFSLGVASGDPAATGVTLWTRLAPRPLEPDGGMEGARVAVSWELAGDEGFTTLVRQGRATAAPELGHSIHVDLQGLDPGRWYFYRFKTGDAVSPVGRTRTAPSDAVTEPLRLGVANCQHYEEGFSPHTGISPRKSSTSSHILATTSTSIRLSRAGSAGTRTSKSPRSRITGSGTRNTRRIPNCAAPMSASPGS